VKQSRARRLGQRVLPLRLKRALRERQLFTWPPVGRVRLGHLRRTTPISGVYGYDRGLPIDRYYVEQFLAGRAADIRGAALEFRDDTYLRRFAGDALTSIDILNYEPDHPGTTLVADLADADLLPTDSFDCIVCTGVIQLVYDLPAAIRNLHGMLRAGGVLLATLPGITRVARDSTGAWEDHWRLTSVAARKVFTEVFGTESVEVEWYGNPLVAITSLMGMAAQELTAAELNARHPDFELLIGVRAVRRS
jgi:SAM-dependent methyltransferase